MFKRILIANRGEIALRIIRACQEMSIETVAVYSTADASSLHVQLADYAVCIGPAKTKDSYLNMENILQAAISYNCEAIHPGFGLLSENSTFARLVEDCGMVFIGPKGDVIDLLGNKSAARKVMIENHVPVVPGSDGSIQNVESAKEVASQIGYPVLIKAAVGGAKAMQNAIDDAGIRYQDIDYINAHGTSTPLNDKCETAAVKTVFKEHCDQLMMSSTKEHTGHCLGAAGAIEGVIVCLGLNQNFVPPTFNYQVQDELCDLDIVANTGRQMEYQYAMSNSLGFGGHNASIIFKKYRGE